MAFLLYVSPYTTRAYSLNCEFIKWTGKIAINDWMRKCHFWTDECDRERGRWEGERANIVKLLKSMRCVCVWLEQQCYGYNTHITHSNQVVTWRCRMLHNAWNDGGRSTARACNNRARVVSNDRYGHKNNLCYRHPWHIHIHRIVVCNERSAKSDWVIQVVAFEVDFFYAADVVYESMLHLASFHYEQFRFRNEIRNTRIYNLSLFHSDMQCVAAECLVFFPCSCRLLPLVWVSCHVLHIYTISVCVQFVRSRCVLSAIVNYVHNVWVYGMCIVYGYESVWI